MMVVDDNNLDDVNEAIGRLREQRRKLQQQRDHEQGKLHCPDCMAELKYDRVNDQLIHVEHHV